MRIVFDTWQFVRIMVRLEETRRADPARKKLWSAWSADWEKLDAELELLRESNFDAFSAAMMDQEVIFDPVDAPTLELVAAISREVAAAIKSAERGAKGEMLTDLQYERTGLGGLAQRLEKLRKLSAKSER